MRCERSDYPTIADSWMHNWQQVISFLAFPDYIRNPYYGLKNALESL